MGRLDNKVAVITGAASGIGRGTAIRFAVEGASVVIADLNQEGGAASVRECRENGGTAIFHKTDVAAESDIQALVAHAVKEFGKHDIIYKQGRSCRSDSLNRSRLGGRLGPHLCGADARCLSWNETRHSRNAKNRRWLDHLHRLDRGALRRLRNARLQRSESRRGESHSLGRARSSETPNPGQLHLSRRNQYSDL